MRARAAFLVVVFLVGAAVASAQPSVTPSRLTTKFKAATGERLRVDTQISYPGHYRAYDAGPVTIASKGKWGTFTVFLVTGPDLAAEMTDLLTDAHTGVLGKPTAFGIYWEKGKTPYGDTYWLAKKRYGKNVVLWWTTPTAAKRTDATFKRLHQALLVAAR